MFQNLSQGATVFLFYRNEPKLERGRIISVNTHLPQFNPSQPQAILGGMVTDLTVAVGSDTIPFAGLPATASVANFQDRGIFVSEDQGMVINEVTATRDNSQRIVDSYDTHKQIRDKCDEILLTLNPDRKKELQNAKDVAELKSELAEMKQMLSAVLGTKKEE